MDVDSPNALKRCSSAPQINNLLSSATVGVQPMEEGQSQPVPSTSGNSGGNITITTTGRITTGHSGLTQQHLQQVLLSEGHPESLHSGSVGSMLNSSNFHQGSTGSRESLPTSFSNIFTPRVRRFSASFSPLAVISNGSASPGRNGSGGTPGPRLTPRISQLRQEECADVSNSREVNHEREIHNAMQMSQSCEDLTLVAENWSFSSGSAGKMVIDDLQNPLHVALPTIGSTCCSSPSPTSRGGIGLQYPTTSPSPTRKFVTRRSMSPCPLRPSPLSSSVKRKFDLEDNYGNCYSPPSKKIFPSERGSSPVCQTPSPLPICPSPDSSTTSFESGSNNNNGNGGGTNIPLCGPFPLAAASSATSSSSSGRITPKFFLAKLSGIPSPGGVGSTAPFGAMSFGGNSGSSSGCSTPTGTTNPIGTLGSGSAGGGGTVSSAGVMMDFGVSSSTGGGVGTPEVHMTVEEEGADGRSKVENTDSIKMACDETSETNGSDNHHHHLRHRRLIIGGSSGGPISSVSRELREQLLKSALDPDAAGSSNSNSSSSSSTSSSSSNSSSSSTTTSDSNNSANATNSNRMSSHVGRGGPSGNALDSSNSSSTSNISSIDTGATAVASAGSTTVALCPPLTSFPIMAIPSNLAEIAES
uniref:Uncharacterized protein n=1 Tax=Anopheles christyi TaxID=43041 RepID=A0A182K4L9_9DIPT